MRKQRAAVEIGGERGIALVLSLFIMLAMSVVAASLMFLSQTETYSSMNYRMMSQARYGAESGIQMASNFLLNESGAGYTAPVTGGADPIASYVTTVSPVTWNGKPVVLSANASVASNYPIAAVQTAFNTAAKGTLAEGNTNVAYAPYATLVSMQQILAANSVDGLDHTVQTWQITADGNITAGTRTATEEVTAILDTQVLSTSSPSVNYAAFATAATCGALKFSGGTATKSYDGSAALVSGNPVTANSSGNVGTNGNLTESGSATINGTLSTPRVGVGSCSAGNVDADTSSGGASVTGGIIQLPSAVTLPTPNIPTPSLGAPTATNLNISNSSRCTDAAIVAIVPAANCHTNSVGNLTITATGATPLVLGNVSVTSSGSLTIASTSSATNTYTINALSVAGAGTLNMGTTTDPVTLLPALPIVLNAASVSSSGGGAATMASGTFNTNSIAVSGGTSLTLDNNSAVTMNVVKTLTLSGGGALTLGTGANPATLALNVVNTAGVTTPLDFSGGTVANPSFDSSRLVIQYGGTGNINLSGGTSQAEVIYAPNAPATFSGGSALYGEVIAATVTDSGGANIYYDRNLATKGLFATTKFFPGNPMLSSFSWKKY